jgi:hypothetical protein
LDREKVTNAQLRDRLQEVNQQYLAKIIAINAGKEVEASLKRQKDLTEGQANAQLTYAETVVKTRQILNDYTSTAEQLADKLRAKFNSGNLLSRMFGDSGQAKTYLNTLERAKGSAESYGEVLGYQQKTVNDARTKEQQILGELKKQYPQLAAQLDEIAKAAEGAEKASEKVKPHAEGMVDERAR